MFNRPLPAGGIAPPQRGQKPGIGMKRPFPKGEPPRMSPIRPTVPKTPQPGFTTPGFKSSPFPSAPPPAAQNPAMPQQPAVPTPGAQQPPIAAQPQNPGIQPPAAPITSPGFTGQPLPSPGQRQLQPTPREIGYTTPGFRPGERPVPDGGQEMNPRLHQVFMERARQMGIGDKEINKFLAAKLRPVNVGRQER